jgi:hypothetical protein
VTSLLKFKLDPIMETEYFQRLDTKLKLKVDRMMQRVFPLHSFHPKQRVHSPDFQTLNFFIELAEYHVQNVDNYLSR